MGIRAAALDCFFEQDFSLKTSMQFVQDGELEKKHLHSFGISRVVDLILAGDQQFDEYKKDSSITLAMSYPPQEMPGTVAANLVRALIKASSENLSLVYKGPGGIGGVADIVLLRPRRGLEWLQRRGSRK